MEQLGNCFLIADEVGLGKTKSAKAVLYEMIRLKNTHDIHCIYMASNESLARQNMNDEFLKSKEANEVTKIFVKNQKENFKGFAEFQKQNAIQALRVLWDKEYFYPKEEQSEQEEKTEKGELNRITDKRFAGRLSCFYPNMCEKEKSYIMQLSPKTSFYNPKESDVYTGSTEERDSIYKDFELFLKWLKNKGKTEALYKKDCWKIRLCEELEWAMKLAYSGVKNIEKEDITAEIIEEIERLSENLTKVDGERDAKKFRRARRIRCNAAVALYRPELIILDEFQRYLQVLDATADGYSVLEMVKYLNKRFEGDTTYSPRVLMLSATPYNYDKGKMNKLSWGYSQNSEFYEVKEEASEEPYDSWEKLREKMQVLGAASGNGRDVFVRTERSSTHMNTEDEFKDEKKIRIKYGNDRKISMGHQFRYLNPLLEFCSKNNLGEKDFMQICRQAYENPEFWRFNYGYKQVAQIEDDTVKKLLLTSRIPGYRAYDNLCMRTLLENIFEENSIPRLWVPPVSEGKIGTGKTLVFTAMQVTTRSVAWLCDKYAKEQISKYNKYEDEKPNEMVISDLTDVVIRAVNSEATFDRKDVRSALESFFNRKFVKYVIAAQEAKEGWNCDSYTESLRKYCEIFKFKEMMEEYTDVLRVREKCSLSVVLSAFSHKTTAIVENTVDAMGELARTYYHTDYSGMFVCDDNQQGQREADVESAKKLPVLGENQTTESLNKICEQFNSPIYPMVLVARSSGQEGFNLQFYGDKLMHWQTPSTVSAFLQREGRLDRPCSLTSRHKIWQWAVQLSENTTLPDGYAKAFALVKDAAAVKNEHQEEVASGLFPLWCIKTPKGISEIGVQQILPIYEYNDSLEEFARELTAAHSYRGAFWKGICEENS